jgi:hypothetical protein
VTGTGPASAPVVHRPTGWAESNPVTDGTTPPTNPDRPVIGPANTPDGDSLSVTPSGSTDVDEDDPITCEVEWGKWGTARPGQSSGGGAT